MVRSVFDWRRCRRAPLRSSRNASTRARRPAPSASRSMRCATVCSRDSQARNLFRRGISDPASCVGDGLHQIVDDRVAQVRQRGRTDPGHAGRSAARVRPGCRGRRRPRRASCGARRSWTRRRRRRRWARRRRPAARSRIRSTAPPRRRRTPPRSAHRRPQLRRLDELVLRQPFAQRRDYRGDAGHPRAGHQHHVAAVDGGRIQPGPDRRHQRVHLRRPDPRRSPELPGSDPRARDHNRSDPRAMSAPQARCRSLTGPSLPGCSAASAPPAAGGRPDRRCRGRGRPPRPGRRRPPCGRPPCRRGTGSR